MAVFCPRQVNITRWLFPPALDRVTMQSRCVRLLSFADPAGQHQEDDVTRRPKRNLPLHALSEDECMMREAGKADLLQYVRSFYKYIFFSVLLAFQADLDLMFVYITFSPLCTYVFSIDHLHFITSG